MLDGDAIHPRQQSPEVEHVTEKANRPKADATRVPATQAAIVETIKTATTPSPKDTSYVGARLPAKYGENLRLLAKETGTLHRELMMEALDMLFRKKLPK